ncbi:hypothetical protein FN846DRAFT_784463 [Sphaerosporella brunnea]|uniref:Factor arrest protein 11 n=1 Tax=Sphaerosporella brunnea TaxID=1250544 RepID=A0A5J5EKB6_9PEZI|nr:hypothetical protein FN846DRAFT_784463 [Sphaerosporella brunnea]
MAQDSRNIDNQGNVAGNHVPAPAGPAGVGAGGGGGGGGGGGSLRIDASRVRERDNRSPEMGQPNGESGGAQQANGMGMGMGMGGGGGGGGQNQGGMAQDSLSLLQLKRLVGDGARLVVSFCGYFPFDGGGNAQPEYAYEYTPTDTLSAELSEWFTYSMPDLSLLIGSPKNTFESTYTKLSLPPHRSAQPLERQSRWLSSKDIKRRRYISRCVDLLDHANQEERVKGLEGLSFVAQGVYGELHEPEEQMMWIKRNNKLLRKVGIAEGVFGCLRKSLNREWEIAQQSAASKGASAGGMDAGMFLTQKAWNRRELRQAMTVLYFLIEVTRQVSEEETGEKDIGLDEELESFRDEITQLPGEGGLLGYLMNNIARVRWEDNVDIPLMHLLLLFWKAMLLVFGSPDKHLAKVKQFARLSDGLSPEVDKTQITANPLDYFLFRQELIAKYPAYSPPKPLFEFETNSYLPNLTGHETSLRSGGNNEVLLGGKGGGETLASILDKAVHIATPMPSPPPSPIAPGKGQKKHNYQTNQSFPFMYPPGGEDCKVMDDAGGVPKSIKEAGDLFAGRSRISLAMRQLWKEKEAFERYGRGWQVGEEQLTAKLQKWGLGDREPRWEEKRLAAVDEFYRVALPQLGSLVIVLFKMILQNITATPPAPPPPPPPPPQNTFADENGTEREAAEKKQWEELDAVRTREITSKAIMAVFLVLLKWFRVSHVLKFEYFTQLLWDSNYIPLVLKLLNQQDIPGCFLVKTDRPDRAYFRICNLHSLSPQPLASSSTESSSPDEACPPPIPFGMLKQVPTLPLDPEHPIVPEIITDLSRRNFFTSINVMRILHKVVKGKSHRNLALVQFRASIIFRKNFKAQQKDLRLYTLKVFKGQVPYCGRKWRQSNMRVITSIYLHCRPELRDDWLAGGDVDADVEEAGPQEEALRALTMFYNVRHYPRSMGADFGMLEEERDFFRRELQRMHDGEDMAEEEEAAAAAAAAQREWSGGEAGW